MEIKPFSKKTITVRDYPDPSKRIPIYGSSKKSKFKINDAVIVVNNPRTGGKKDRIIGFDKNGDAMLEFCSWENTRGGYEDSSLVSWKEFKAKLKSKFSNEIEEKIEEGIQEGLKFLKSLKSYDEKNEKTFSERYRMNYLKDNYYRLI
jgi:hypothetical protein